MTCILYLIFSKSYRPESKYDKLTKEVSLAFENRQNHALSILANNLSYTLMVSSDYLQEEDQLIAEWEPEPLVPTEHPSDREVDPAPIITGYIDYIPLNL